MTNNAMYKDYAHTIRNKLIDDVNGKVTFEVVPEADCIIMYIAFKDFKFRYVITEASQSIYHGTSDEVVKTIEQRYRQSITNGFFRTEISKERLNRRKLGIDKEVEV